MKSSTADNVECNDKDTTLTRIVAASVAGNAMEWYDFFLYGTAAALVFGQIFFPQNADPLVGTFAAFGAFAVGFIARPLGGAVFGHIGDRFSRKTSLVWTLLLMGGATFAIGLLPTYAQAGVWSPILLVILRLLQGLATGGEWGGGVVMISENAPEGKRGFYSAWSQAGVSGGFVLSSGAFLAAQTLPHDQFISWGWRLPFLASLIIFGLGIYIRTSIPESRDFKRAEQSGKTLHMPVLEVIRKYPKEILISIGLRIAESGGIYIFLAFSLVYGKYIGIAPSTMLLGVMIAMMVEMPAMLMWGWLSDRFGRKPIFRLGAILLLLLAFPFFWALNTHSTPLIYLALILGTAVSHGAMIGTEPALFSELFRTEVRYSGLALGHEISAALAGGLSPLIATGLLAHFHSYWPVSIFLVLMALTTIVTLRFTPETRTRA